MNDISERTAASCISGVCRGRKPFVVSIDESSVVLFTAVMRCEEECIFRAHSQSDSQSIDEDQGLFFVSKVLRVNKRCTLN